MATSTIFANITLSGKDAEAFVDALEKSAKNAPKLQKPKGRQITDPQEIRKLFGVGK